ncbi:MAG: hypothetical protein NT129_00105 [Candidatus Aenigmarchaeota archaeon]|nr:hypothetical protein [Candidatus Aenigmarchaeota archaeon]
MTKKEDEIIQKILERLRIGNIPDEKLKVEVYKGGGGGEGPTFDIQVPKKVSMDPGKDKQVDIIVQSIKGFSGIVSLTASDSAGVHTGIPNSRVFLNPDESKTTDLLIHADDDAFGEHDILIEGVSSIFRTRKKPEIIKVIVSGKGPEGKQTIYGYVYSAGSEKKKAIPGVSVYLAGGDLPNIYNTITNEKGFYKIENIQLTGDITVAAEKEFCTPKPAYKIVNDLKAGQTRRCEDFELSEGVKEDEIERIVFQHSIGKLTTGEAVRELIKKGLSENEAKYRLYGTHTFKMGLGGTEFGSTSGPRLYRRGAPGGIPHYVPRGLFFGKIKEGPAQTVQGMDPKLRSAINAGRRNLQKRAKNAYDDIAGDKIKEFEQAKKNVKTLMDDYNKQIKKLKKFASGREGILKQLTKGPKAAGGIGAIVGMLANFAAGSGATEKAEIDAINLEIERIGKELERAERNFDDLIKEQMKSDEIIAKMQQRLVTVVDQIVADLIIRRKDLEEKKDIITTYLNNEANRLAYFYGKQYRGKISRYAGWVGMTAGNLASGMQTWGDVWGLFWDNIKTIIFGPWVWGSLLIFLQFLMISAWVSPIIPGTQFYLYMMPFLLGLFTFMMNIESSKQPMDWITHIVSGTLIGFTTILLLIAIWTPQDLATFNFAGSSDGLWYNSWIFFFFIWFIIAFFVGVFQFYRSGGFIIVFQMAIIITIFAYLALGPYSGYYNYVLGEVKPPFVMAFRTVGSAFENIWMLATNPTKWYEQQQRVNIVPETPISEPLALEVKSIAPRTRSVPVCEEFAVDVIIRNEGDMDVNNVNATAECNNWCKLPDPNKNYLTAEDSIFKPREGTAFTVSNIKGMALKGREAEYHNAKVTVKISYTSGTNSSLKMTAMNENEIDYIISQGKEPYKPVIAVGKTTPARLSLNVGPQPLKAGDNATLLVSVSNGRSDGNIILEKGTNIRIRVDRNLSEIDTGSCGRKGKIVKCTYESSTPNIINCITQNTYEIKSYNFDSIFYFMCDMTVKYVESVKTGLITAELPNYTFTVKRSVDVALTAPLGILENEDLPLECVQGGSTTSGTTSGGTTTTAPGGEGSPGGTTVSETTEGTIDIYSVASYAGGDKATITWETDTESDSSVTYWPYDNEAQQTPIENTDLTTSHAITIEGLSGTYRYYVNSIDANGKSGKSGEHGFTTGKCSDLVIIYNTNMINFVNLEKCNAASDKCKVEGAGITRRCVPLDNNAPVISDVMSNIDGNTATITWNTDEWSTSKVFYKKYLLSYIDYNQLNLYYSIEKSSDTFTKEHSIVLDNLDGNVYIYKVESSDQYGNVKTTDIRGFAKNDCTGLNEDLCNSISDNCVFLPKIGEIAAHCEFRNT